METPTYYQGSICPVNRFVIYCRDVQAANLGIHGVSESWGYSFCRQVASIIPSVDHQRANAMLREFGLNPYHFFVAMEQ